MYHVCPTVTREWIFFHNKVSLLGSDTQAHFTFRVPKNPFTARFTEGTCFHARYHYYRCPILTVTCVEVTFFFAFISFQIRHLKNSFEWTYLQICYSYEESQFWLGYFKKSLLNSGNRVLVVQKSSGRCFWGDLKVKNWDTDAKALMNAVKIVYFCF